MTPMNQVTLFDMLYIYETLRKIPKPTKREKEMLAHIEPQIYCTVMGITTGKFVATPAE